MHFLQKHQMYIIKLENNEIGTARFEYGDPPMGVVTGKIVLSKPECFYEFLVQYLQDREIQTTILEPDGKFIATMVIPELKVFRVNGSEISGLGANIEGTERDGYEITIIGIPYPLYEEEFAHHVAKYNEN